MTTPDFFSSRLDQIIDLRHPLAVLATRLPWAVIETESGVGSLVYREARIEWGKTRKTPFDATTGSL